MPPASVPTLIAAATVLALLVLAVLPRLPRRHRAPEGGTVSPPPGPATAEHLRLDDPAPAPAVPPEAADPAPFLDLDAALAQIVDDTATDLTGAPTGNALGVNPLTGTTHARHRHDPRTGKHDAAPSRRPVPTPADPDDPRGGPTTTLTTYSPSPDSARPDLPDASVDVANTLADAFAARDVDTLAAMARQMPEHAAAAHLLAAAAGSATGDPRAFGHLHDAYDTGADPAELPELGPFRDQITFTVTMPDAHVAATLPCTREHLALALAAAEYAVADSASALTILTDLRHPLAAVLAATVALDLGDRDAATTAVSSWHAAQAAAAPADGWTAALAVPAARLALEDPAGSAAAAARAAVTAGQNALPVTDPAIDAAALELTLLCLSAQVDLADGDTAGAWATLTTLLHRHPGHGPARALLKAL